jgi:hypothetical protein
MSLENNSIEEKERSFALYESQSDEESQTLLHLRKASTKRKRSKFAFLHILCLYGLNATLSIMVVVLLAGHKTHDPSLGVWCMNS